MWMQVTRLSKGEHCSDEDMRLQNSINQARQKGAKKKNKEKAKSNFLLECRNSSHSNSYKHLLLYASHSSETISQRTSAPSCCFVSVKNYGLRL